MFEVFCLVVIAAAYLRRDEVLWAVGGVFSGVLAFLSQAGIGRLASDGSLVIFSFPDQSLFFIHTGVALLCVLFMLLDLNVKLGMFVRLSRWSRRVPVVPVVPSLNRGGVRK